MSVECIGTKVCDRPRRNGAIGGISRVDTAGDFPVIITTGLATHE